MTGSERPTTRIHLSPPDVGKVERDLLLEAFDSNWIAPLGPHVDGFEREVAAWLHEASGGRGSGSAAGDVHETDAPVDGEVEAPGARPNDDTGGTDEPWHAVALSSGTAGLHLALLDLGVGPGDEVVTSTFTFAATANAITYVGATPVFVDVDPATWQMDPSLLAELVADRVADGPPPAAVVTVDLYGVPTDHAAVRRVCEPHGIPVVEDAAEALGTVAAGRAAGMLGDVGVLSFNGNKIITTGGGGMVVTPDADRAARLRHLATQARDPAPHYQHSRIGHNYRLSNLLAAVGRGQLRSLDDKVRRRRAVNLRYRDHLAPHGVQFLREPPDVRWNAWLTCVVVAPADCGVDRERVRTALVDVGIEARPLWKPMHLQPVFANAQVVDNGVADALFADGLCLPSGSALRDEQVDEVAERIVAELDR